MSRLSGGKIFNNFLNFIGFNVSWSLMPRYALAIIQSNLRTELEMFSPGNNLRTDRPDNAWGNDVILKGNKYLKGSFNLLSLRNLDNKF